MHTFFAMVHLFPFWALPIAIILFELGRHFKRRKDKRANYFFGAVGCLCVMTVAWLVFRGDIHSDRWVRTMTGQNWR